MKNYNSQLITSLISTGINPTLAEEIANLILPNFISYENADEKEEKEKQRLMNVKHAIQETLILTIKTQ